MAGVESQDRARGDTVAVIAVGKLFRLLAGCYYWHRWHCLWEFNGTTIAAHTEDPQVNRCKR